MSTSHHEADSPHGDGAEWIRLSPITTDVAGAGCIGVFLIVFAAPFVWGGTGALLFSGFSGAVAGTLFVLSGLAIGAMGGRLLLQAVGPRPRLWIDRGHVDPGTTFNVRWEATGRVKEARSIHIKWEGREIAEVRAYNPTLHTAVFEASVLTSGIGALTGTASVVLPQVTMPSFRARYARISWVLEARVETRRWPVVEESYIIEVLPNGADQT